MQIRVLFSLTAALLCAVFTSSTQAQSSAFTYQGSLTENGSPANGFFDISYGLWDDASAGSQVGDTLTNTAVAVVNGLFTVTLDFGPGVFSGGDRWLEIGVVTNGGGAFSTLSPRQPITPTPYAMQAANAASAATATSADSVSAGDIVGTVALSQLPAAVVTNGATGVNITGTFSGDGAGITGVELGNLNSQGAIVVTTNPLSYGFVWASSPGVGTFPYAFTSADVNGDGKPDLISANSVNTLSVLTNNGSGSFVLSSSPSVGSDPRSLTSADVNGDGKPDLISANYGNNTLSVLTNNGSGSFFLSTSPGVGTAPLSITSADVDEDGQVDLITANLAAASLSVLTNDGSGGFVLSASPGVGTQPFSVTSADVNGDGHVDLISANRIDGTLTVLTNNASGGFVLSSSPGVGVNPVDLASADVNGDGHVDLMSANSGNNTLTVLTNNASGGFVLSASPGVSSPNSVTSTDVTGDGKPDLISGSSANNTLTVLTNNYSSLSYVTSFTGNGAGLTDVTVSTVAASNITGTVTLDQLAANSTDSSKIVNGSIVNADINIAAAIADIKLATISTAGKVANSALSTNVSLLGASITSSEITDGTIVNSDINATAGIADTKLATLSTAGKVADSALSANVALLNGANVFTGTDRFAGVVLATNVNNQFTGIFSGDGAGLMNVTVNSSNVALRTGGNTFSGQQRIFDTIITGSEALDQQQASESVLDGSLDAWQSFTAGQSGPLTKIALKVRSPLGGSDSPGTVRIYGGEGTAGALLATESVTFVGVVSTFQAFPLSIPPFVIAGSQYTIRFSAPAGSTSWAAVDNANPYSGGRASTVVFEDYAFETYVSPYSSETVLTANPPGYSGNVGIGTDAPQAKLHVVGDILASGTITGNGGGLTNVTVAAANITGTVGLAQLAANSVSSSQIVDGAIVNADINTAAAISDTKLATISTAGKVSDSALSANVSKLGASIESSEITGGTIINADINAAAAIADTKLATISTAGKVSDSALSANVSLLGSSIASSEISDGTIVAADLASGAVNSTTIANGTIVTADLASSLQPALVPIGSVIDWWRPNGTFPVPTGYKICDGTAVADGGSPYNGQAVPNLNNKFVRGTSNPNSIGSIGGTDTHAHSVSANGTTAGAGAHNHQWGSYYRSGSTKNWRTYNSAGSLITMYSTTSDGIGGGSGQFPMREQNQGSAGTYNYYTTLAGNHAHSVTVYGSSSNGNNVPAYVGLLKIMRIK